MKQRVQSDFYQEHPIMYTVKHKRKKRYVRIWRDKEVYQRYAKNITFGILIRCGIG